MILQQLKQQAGIEDNPDQEGLDLFAELIVKECASLVVDDYVILEHFGLDVNETLRNRSTYFGNDI